MSKSEKDRQKYVQEKCQQILNDLLRDEDNKYCVDCDAKGPRWASWNLGIFLCIRCAGIHRNLGVHISKVKSINLDAWTPEQIGYIQNMGNSKARAVYEANLPDNFRRPQNDSALETFIRSKYEQKKYIAKEWVPSTPPPAFDVDEERRKEREKRIKKSSTQSSNATSDLQTSPLPRPVSSPAATVINVGLIADTNVSSSSSSSSPKLNHKSSNASSSNVSAKASNDLLGLDSLIETADNLTLTSIETNQNSTQQLPASISNASDNKEDDLFDAFVSAPIAMKIESKSAVNESANIIHSNGGDMIKAMVNSDEQQPLKPGNNDEADFFNQTQPSETKLDKESIMKLYETSANANVAATQSSVFPITLNNQLPIGGNANNFQPSTGINVTGLTNPIGLSNPLQGFPNTAVNNSMLFNNVLPVSNPTIPATNQFGYGNPFNAQPPPPSSIATNNLINSNTSNFSMNNINPLNTNTNINLFPSIYQQTNSMFNVNTQPINQSFFPAATNPFLASSLPQQNFQVNIDDH